MVATVQEALADPHFAARALFAPTLSNQAGAGLPALPVAVLPPFRTKRPQASVPALGADNDALLGRF